jgi:hypothetical protein
VVAVRPDGRRRAEQVNRGGAGVVGALGPHRDARELRRVVGPSHDSL